MKKKFVSVVNVLCSSVLAAIGVTGCKNVNNVMPPYSEKMYGPPPVIYKERVDTVIKEEIKVVYGPPVVTVREPDWNEARPDEEGVYDVAEVMPQFPGGEKALADWINSHLVYPEGAGGAYGRVIVSFIVMTDGTLDGVTVKRSIHPLLDAEAIRVVKAMPKWYPGRMGGLAVPVRYFIPIRF